MSGFQHEIKKMLKKYKVHTFIVDCFPQFARLKIELQVKKLTKIGDSKWEGFLFYGIGNVILKMRYFHF